jgi:3-oxoadipate enol-lactonase
VRYPELVRAVVLANTSAQYPQAARAVFEQRIAAVQGGGMAAIVESVLERYFSAAFRASRPEVVAAYRAVVLRCDPAGYAACCAAVAGTDWLERLSQVACPALIIAGALDVGAPVAMAQAIAERIGGAELVVIDETAHLSVVEQPHHVERLVRAFLARIGG